MQARNERRDRAEAALLGALVADAARLGALTGWRPETDLASGLGHCVDWWRERIAAGRQRRDSGFAR